MAGLLDQMRTAQATQSQGLLSHRPVRRVTGRDAADAFQTAGLLSSPIPIVGDAMGLLGDAAMYAAKPEERTLGNAALTALGALPFVPSVAGKMGKKAKRAADVAPPRDALDKIADWKWRDMAEVRKALDGLDSVDPYITDTYGKFMADQAAKAGRGEMGPRDVIKAYDITRSSVNRGARNVKDSVWFQPEAARPEGYMAEWLMTRAGRKYLDAAEAGRVDEAAIGDLVERFKPFGMAQTLGDDMRYIAQAAPKLGSPPVLGSIDEWRSYAQAFPGIGPSKSGFFASLLGRGDLPTLDARQLRLHTGAGGKEAAKYMSRGGGIGGDQAVDRLAARQAELGLSLPPELAQNYQHLTHHAIWDRTAGTRTTHEDLVRAMQRGAVDPRLLGGMALGLGGGLLGYEYSKEQ